MYKQEKRVAQPNLAIDLSSAGRQGVQQEHTLMSSSLHGHLLASLHCEKMSLDVSAAVIPCCVISVL